MSVAWNLVLNMENITMEEVGEKVLCTRPLSRAVSKRSVQRRANGGPWYPGVWCTGWHYWELVFRGSQHLLCSQAYRFQDVNVSRIPINCRLCRHRQIPYSLWYVHILFVAHPLHLGISHYAIQCNPMGIHIRLLVHPSICLRSNINKSWVYHRENTVGISSNWS